MNYLKAEVYRLRRLKIVLYSLLLIIIYTAFGNYIYKVNDLFPKDLYNNFGEEYLLIFFVLGFGMLVYLFADDINNKLFYEYDRFFMCMIKIFLWFIYLIIVILITFVFSCTFSLLFNLGISLSFAMIFNVIRILPIIIVYNLFLLLFLFIGIKTSYTTTIVLGLYIFFNYLEASLVSIDSGVLKYFTMFNLNFNNLYISWYYALLNLILLVFFLSFVIRYYLKRMT